jgi:hypothetical protein
MLPKPTMGFCDNFFAIPDGSPCFLRHIQICIAPPNNIRVAPSPGLSWGRNRRAFGAGPKKFAGLCLDRRPAFNGGA